MNSFRDLIVWQKSHQLVLASYKATNTYPKDELYGLTSQIRRAVVSIAANIVEGYKRKTDKQTLQFLNISDASLEEFKYLMLLSKDLEYISSSTYKDKFNNSEEVGRLLSGFQKSFKNRLDS
jgi:four helix bundle protein